MKPKNILTVDLEDWFHICGVEDIIPESSWALLESRVEANTMKILRILKNQGTRATFFILGFIAERHPDLVMEIDHDGHEIATHGYAHRKVHTLTPAQFREDLKQSIDIISSITRKPVTGYRAPEWSIRDDSLWALEILQREGFEYDASMAPLMIIGNQNYGRTPYKRHLLQGTIWEFPPLVWNTPIINLPLGGGWGLRVFPYPIIRSAIRKMNRQGHPAVIFLHPREFDRNNPRIGLPVIKKVVLSARIARVEKRLIRLLNDFDFVPVRTAMTELNRSFIKEGIK